MNSHDEPTSIQAACRGDRNAFDRLVNVYGPQLLRFLERRLDSGLAEDVYQDTLLSAWVHMPAFNGRSSFKTWLFSIGLNKCRDCLRRPPPLPMIQEDLPIQERGYERTDAVFAVRQALSQLDPEHRMLLEMYYAEQMTLKHIAEKLDRNLNSVKYNFYRAHKSVAQLMGVDQP